MGIITGVSHKVRIKWDHLFGRVPDSARETVLADEAPTAIPPLPNAPWVPCAPARHPALLAPGGPPAWPLAHAAARARPRAPQAALSLPGTAAGLSCSLHGDPSQELPGRVCVLGEWPEHRTASWGLTTADVGSVTIPRAGSPRPRCLGLHPLSGLSGSTLPPLPASGAPGSLGLWPRSSNSDAMFTGPLLSLIPPLSHLP